MRTTMLAAVAALSLGIGIAVTGGGDTPAAHAEYASLPNVLAQKYRRDDGDLAQLTTRQTGNVELASVTTTRGYSTQQWKQNEGVGG